MWSGPPPRVPHPWRWTSEGRSRIEAMPRATPAAALAATEATWGGTPVAWVISYIVWADLDAGPGEVHRDRSRPGKVRMAALEQPLPGTG